MCGVCMYTLIVIKFANELRIVMFKYNVGEIKDGSRYLEMQSGSSI